MSKNIDHDAARAAVTALLTALGYDAKHPAIADTPKRVAKAWSEMLSGGDVVAEEILRTDFEAEGYDQLVLLRNVPFYSTCEHHLLPFHGSADVAYIPKPGGRVVGLSKLARLVEMHARRLQLQERMTKCIADDLERVLDAAGVSVTVHAVHLCMVARGVQKSGAEMVTSDVRGVFRTKPEARAELLALSAKR